MAAAAAGDANARAAVVPTALGASASAAKGDTKVPAGAAGDGLTPPPTGLRAAGTASGGPMVLQKFDKPAGAAETAEGAAGPGAATTGGVGSTAAEPPANAYVFAWPTPTGIVAARWPIAKPGAMDADVGLVVVDGKTSPTEGKASVAGGAAAWGTDA